MKDLPKESEEEKRMIDQLPIPNGRGCNERGWKLVLRFDSIGNLFRIDR